MQENNSPLRKIRDLAKELGCEDDYVDRVYLQEYAGSLPDETDPDDLLDAVRAKLFLLFKAAALIAEENMEKQGLLPKDGSFLVFIEPTYEDASAILITYRAQELLYATFRKVWNLQGMSARKLAQLITQTAAQVESKYRRLLTIGVIEIPAHQ